jgi:hypothetical protein
MKSVRLVGIAIAIAVAIVGTRSLVTRSSREKPKALEDEIPMQVALLKDHAQRMQEIERLEDSEKENAYYRAALEAAKLEAEMKEAESQGDEQRAAAIRKEQTALVEIAALERNKSNYRDMLTILERIEDRRKHVPEH